MAAYRSGIFPSWYREGDPIRWWSLDPRLILEPLAFQPTRRLMKLVRQKIFEVTSDTAFSDVIRACAATRRRGQRGTWILPEMLDAYGALHDAGHAHSIEVRRCGVLVGGLYGVAAGKVFFGESMFSRESNASKIALVRLVEMLSARGYHFIDCQQTTEHMMRLGAVEISRKEFLLRLAGALTHDEPPGRWK